MFNFPVTIDRFTREADGRLLVEGTATTETPVWDPELMDELILDYDASKRAAESYSGAIREMHKNEAVGRALDVSADDATRSIRIKAFVSEGAPLTQKKVIDGTLRGFSVGGKVKSVVTDGTRKRATEWNWIETSIVDVGADPGANDLSILLCRGAELQPALVGSQETAMSNPAGQAGSESVQANGVNRFAEALAAVVPQPPVTVPIARKAKASAALTRVFKRGAVCRHFDGGSELDDLFAAQWLLEDLGWMEARLEALIAAEAVEMIDGEDEAAQIAGLKAGLDALEALEMALKGFIGAEAAELVAPEPTEPIAEAPAGDAPVENAAASAAPGAPGADAPIEKVAEAEMVECADCKGGGMIRCARCDGAGEIKKEASVENAARPRIVRGYASLSRKIDSLARSVSTPKPFVATAPEPLTARDGVEMVLAIGGKLNEHASSVTRALDVVTEVRTGVQAVQGTTETITRALGEFREELKAVRDGVNVIAKQPAVTAPVRFEGAPAMARAAAGGDHQPRSAFLAGLSESAPTTEMKAWLRAQARAAENRGE